MSRVCTICSHPARNEIDRAALAGASNRRIADQFSISPQALMRHKADHLLPELVKAQQAEEVTRATDLLAAVTERDRVAMEVLAEARAEGDHRAVAPLLRVSLVALELLGRLHGQLSTEVNIVVLPQWIEYRTALLQALAPYPAAMDAAADVLIALEAER
jgi:hypothetical protein